MFGTCAVTVADMLFCGTEVVARRGNDVKIVYCSSIYPYINRKPASWVGMRILRTSQC